MTHHYKPSVLAMVFLGLSFAGSAESAMRFLNAFRRFQSNFSLTARNNRRLFGIGTVASAVAATTAASKAPADEASQTTPTRIEGDLLVTAYIPRTWDQCDNELYDTSVTPQHPDDLCVAIQATSRDNENDVIPPIGLGGTATAGIIHHKYSPAIGQAPEDTLQKLAKDQKEWADKYASTSSSQKYWRITGRDASRSDNWEYHRHPKLPAYCRFPDRLPISLFDGKKEGDEITFNVCKKHTKDGLGIPVFLRLNQRDYYHRSPGNFETALQQLKDEAAKR